MAAAEQAVCRTEGRDAGGGDPLDTLREPGQLRLGVAVVGGVLDVGVVGGDPLEQHALLGGGDAGQRHGLLDLDPLPVGAGLELEVHAGGPPLRAGRAGQRRDGRGVVEGEAQVGGDGVLEVLRRRVAQAEDGHVRADQAAQGDALVRAPDREPGCAGADRGGGHERHAVAVGLALHHGRELRAAETPGEGADVGGQRAEVDLEPAHRARGQSGGAGGGRRGGVGHARQDSPERPPARRSGRIPPCGEAVDPRGRECYLSRPCRTRGVAQPGSALAWGASGRWFKSSRPDSEKAPRFLAKAASRRGLRFWPFRRLALPVH